MPRSSNTGRRVRPFSRSHFFLGVGVAKRIRLRQNDVYRIATIRAEPLTNLAESERIFNLSAHWEGELSRKTRPRTQAGSAKALPRPMGWRRFMKTLSRPRRYRIFDRDGWRCQYCGELTHASAHDGPEERVATVDHKIPQCAGGDSSDDNLVTACKSCNSSKCSLSIEDFRILFSLQASPYKSYLRLTSYRALQELGALNFELQPATFHMDKVSA